MKTKTPSLYPLKIKQVKREAQGSADFIFEVPTEQKALFYYRPAQFLTFEFQLKGQSFLRSYSISSCPLLGEPLQTTVKRVTGGVISNYMIDHLKEGDVLMSRKPAGRFFKAPADLKPKHYYLFAGGSGITPLFSILKTVLLSDPNNKVTLFYANRNEKSVIYFHQLKEWLNRYPQQFNMILILSQPESTKYDIKGRLQKSHLEEYFSATPLINKADLYYLCGPLGFMEEVQNFLLENQAEKRHIRKESFLSVSQKTKQVDSPKLEIKQVWSLTDGISLKGKNGGDEKAPPETIKAFINEEEISIPAEADIPILEQMLSAGHSPPFSCLSGSCMSCLAILKKGQVVQEERGILEEENIKNHEILTCQAKPVSRLVEVDYD